MTLGPKIGLARKPVTSFFSRTPTKLMLFGNYRREQRSLSIHCNSASYYIQRPIVSKTSSSILVCTTDNRYRCRGVVERMIDRTHAARRRGREWSYASSSMSCLLTRVVCIKLYNKLVYILWLQMRYLNWRILPHVKVNPLRHPDNRVIAQVALCIASREIVVENCDFFIPRRHPTLHFCIFLLFLLPFVVNKDVHLREILLEISHYISYGKLQ